MREQEQGVEVPRNVELVKTEGTLKENGVLVSSLEEIEELSSRGYGVPQNGNLLLTFYEALFLLSKGIIEVKDEKTGQEVGFQNLLQCFQSVEENAWVKYLVYRDLRSRGYVVREGFGLGVDYRVYDRGEYGKEIAKHLIFVIQEGQPVSVKELARVLKYVQNLKKRLILAVINRRGEIVFYSLSQMTF
ncbi:MAG: tRNA-intron lyase [Candidatus Bathyarchaeota archaeon]|nr:tRNA-intron lyase [Candidatus Bathyarchaeota archaeon]MDH5733839.1 tRNA-intron lyase [Candidatus Bathyarchaeota archaeon]